MSNIKISQVKLIKQGEGLELTLKNNEGVVSTDGKECKEAVHPDMVEAVNALVPHLAIHTDYLSEKEAMKRENLTPFIVTGYSWNQKETGITLTGVRTTSRGKSIVLNVMLPMEGEAAEEYALQADFNKKIKVIEKEVNAYLAGEKKLQASLFPDEDGKMKTVTNMKIDRPEGSTDENEEGEWSPGEYSDEVDKTTALREAGKVVPIKKGKGKAAKKPADQKEWTPEELEARAASRRKPGVKEKTGKK